MNWRQLRPGELDHEAIWLAVSIAALGGAWVWLQLALPIPECTFHRVTGWACPTCGMTRCLRYVFHLRWQSAAAINPLAFLGFSFLAIYNFYAAIALVLRLPRLRFDSLSAGVRHRIRLATITAILGNWAWLLWIGL